MFLSGKTKFHPISEVGEVELTESLSSIWNLPHYVFFEMFQRMSTVLGLTNFGPKKLGVQQNLNFNQISVYQNFGMGKKVGSKKMLV